MIPSKFRNKKSPCVLGHIHDSKLEAGYCNMLSALKKAGEIRDFEIQKTFRIVVNGEHICDHIVDFTVLNKNGDAEIHEAKGVRTDVWKIKYALVRALWPEIPYHIIERSSYGRKRRAARIRPRDLDRLNKKRVSGLTRIRGFCRRPR
jgi:hypothetical protein